MARFDLQDFKKQASFLLREIVNDARLALTDVSRIQLLTEEATNEDSWGPETRTMAMLADAAFELEEYERIVQVIHCRLEASKKRPWRQVYKTLVVLEYLLTHGPNSLGREFRGDINCVEELLQFQFTDEQGIDRGSIVRKKADRVLELLNNPDLRKEEITRARKISFGIRGFGSSVNQELPETTVEDTEQQSRQGDSKELSNNSSEEIGNAAIETPQLGLKRVSYEKSLSMSPQLTQDVSNKYLSEGSVLATSQPLEGQSQMRLFKKSLSSPGYFRESLPRLSWQPADDVINELEEANTCLLDAVEHPSCHNMQEEREETGILMSWKSEVSTEEGPMEDGSLNTAPHENANSIFENIDTFSLAENCESSTQWYGGEQQSFNFPNFHNLPHPDHPKIRMKFQHQWQPPSLVDCGTKFGKAV